MRAQGGQGQLKATTLLLSLLLFSPLLFSLATLILLLPSSISAQAVAPTPVHRLEYTFYPDKTLYIRGGLNQGNTVAQFFSLDLTPLLSHSGKLTWKRLNHTGGLSEFRSMTPMTVDRLNTVVTIFIEDDSITRYQLLTDTWSNAYVRCANTIEDNASIKGGLASTIDPKSGLTYIAGGYANYSQMLVYDPTGFKCSGSPMPSIPKEVDSTSFRVAWSASKDTIYLFGDVGSPTPGPGLWEFQFATKNWEQIPIQGNQPALHSQNCMVSALGGQKLVVFGGSNVTSIGSNIYIFDTIAYRWTVGAMAPDVRTEMACASAGDYFLFWGGIDRMGGSPADIVFYNIKTDKWVKQGDIAPPANTSIGTVLSSTNSTTGSGGSISTGTPDTTLASKSNTAAIGGGIAGAIVVTVAIVGFLFVRRRHRTQAGTKRDGSPDIVAVALPENKPDTPLSSTHTSPRRTSNSYVGSSVEKAHAVGNPQMPTTPPANEGGGYADTQGYGQSAAYPPPPPSIPGKPQLYNNLAQHHTSNNNPQYISPSALALGQVFPQPPPTTRNPQTFQGSSTHNDNNFESITDPLQKLALIQAELESVRKQIENQDPTRRS